MAPVEALSLASQIVNFFKDAAPLVGALGTVTLIIYCWWRAGSAHFLLERIWWLLGGSKEFDDAYLNAHWKKVRDLELARFRTGIRFPSQLSVAKTFTWLETNSIPLGELLKGASYFDPESIEIKDPQINKKKSNFKKTFSIILIFIITLMLFSIPESAFLTVKKTGTQFWTNAETAHAWNGISWKITAENCQSGKIPLEDEHDAKVICELISSDDKSFVENSIRSQRILSSAFTVVLATILLYLGRLLGNALTAQRILEKTSQPLSHQLELDCRPRRS